MLSLRKSLVVAVVVALLAVESPSRVAPTTLRKLTTTANLVVVGRVTRLLKVKDVRIAELQVMSTLKGAHHSRLYYLAQPTWTCDTTNATVGQETLFFFERYAFEPHQSASSVGEYKEPVGFRQEIQKLVGETPLLIVSSSGRGQMPVRLVQGKHFVTMWVGDVQLPNHIKTIDGPDPAYSGLRSAPLSAITDFVRRQP